MSRSTDKMPHNVGLYLNGVWTHSTTVRWADPRFVKAEELLQIAYQEIMDRETRGRRHDDKGFEWDALRVSFGWLVLFCDRKGNRIPDPRDDNFPPVILKAA